mmetsp:Transcript_39939/g.78536  ORF Transcript_39939/g.78536 Transcript_39939/m.78536 type:complete len:114 (-) Transcript_39939:33-374(-)
MIGTLNRFGSYYLLHLRSGVKYRNGTAIISGYVKCTVRGKLSCSGFSASLARFASSLAHSLSLSLSLSLVSSLFFAYLPAKAIIKFIPFSHHFFFSAPISVRVRLANAIKCLQ